MKNGPNYWVQGVSRVQCDFLGQLRAQKEHKKDQKGSEKPLKTVLLLTFNALVLCYCRDA